MALTLSLLRSSKLEKKLAWVFPTFYPTLALHPSKESRVGLCRWRGVARRLSSSQWGPLTFTRQSKEHLEPSERDTARQASQCGFTKPAGPLQSHATCVPQWISLPSLINRQLPFTSMQHLELQRGQNQQPQLTVCGMAHTARDLMASLQCSGCPVRWVEFKRIIELEGSLKII